VQPWRASALLILAAANGYVWGLLARPPLPLRVTFLDVGQGDAAVIEAPSGRVALLDSGRADGNSDHARSVVLPYLRSRGINGLDAVALSHWDQDHAGGAASVMVAMRARMLLVPLWDDPRHGPTQTEARTLRIAAMRGIPRVSLVAGQEVQVGGGCSLVSLNPPEIAYRPAPRTDNDASLVFMLRYGATRVLLPGDAGAEAEHSMVRRRLDLRADVLKLGHHGSASATSDRWLDAVRPKAAIISVGRRNPFGHPDRRVLARLRRRGIRVFRTDERGAITVLSDGAQLSIRSVKRVR